MDNIKEKVDQIIQAGHLMNFLPSIRWLDSEDFCYLLNEAQIYGHADESSFGIVYK